MILDNKYHIWYLNIVNKAKQRVVSPDYIENHHIIPKSFGGSNNNGNMVSLTLREHYICHVLLTKFTTGEHRKKMCWALHRMTHTKNYVLNSRQYEYARKIHSENVSKNHPSYSDSEWSKRNSESNKKHWEHNVTRRKQASENFKNHWKDNYEEMANNSRENGKKGGGEHRRGKKFPEEGKLRMGNKNPSSKIFTFKDSCGTMHTTDNLKQFCLDNGLTYKCILKVTQGANTNHKGFILISKSQPLFMRQ